MTTLAAESAPPSSPGNTNVHYRRPACAADTDTATGTDRSELRMPGIGLAEVLERAALQTRVDVKYLLTPDRHRRFLRALAEAEDWGCLEIDGRRDFGYRSVYFDTSDLLTFRQHRQGRRRRFKIRTRTYLDTGSSMFEVKLRGARESTLKERIDHPLGDAERLSDPAQEFLAATLWEAYHLKVPQGLCVSAKTEYRRRTLVHLGGETRITCDSALVCSSPHHRRAAAPMVVVETKSAAPGGPADRLLWSLGARPMRISKYCLAAATLTPGITAGPWRRAQKLLFPNG
jgi:hypothetical protein